MATQVASLFGVLDLRDNLTPGLSSAKTGLTGFSSHLSTVGGQVKDFGQKLTVAMLPVTAALGLSVNAAVNFDEAVTNVGAVLGLTTGEIKNLKGELLEMSSDTRAGPQAVADAFYDIVGGVADASTHWDILNASIKTSEAGNADLAGTTKALISVMNAYKFSAKDAGMVSDVLTRTVGMGVGTMDEFAAALPNVTGLSHSLGISFEDVGTMMAYLTTQGNSASESATQLSGMMTAMLNPNENMKDALKELGYETGQAAIEQLGLLGAYEALRGTQTAQTMGMSELVGRLEALRGVTSFAGEDVRDFFGKFRDGLAGATDQAREIQMGSAAAQFDLLKTSVSELGIELGDALMPVLLDIASGAKEVVKNIIEWTIKNPEATKTILMVAGALVILGPVIMVTSSAVGLLTSGVGALKGIVMLLGGAFTLLTSPIMVGVLALTALIGTIALAIKNVEDLKRAVSDIVNLGGAGGATAAMNQIANDARQRAGLGGLATGNIPGLGGYQTGGNNPVFNAFGMRIKDAGGSGAAGGMYGIGVNEMYEGRSGKIFFMPGESGQFNPMGGGGMGGMHIGSVTVYANDAVGGAAAGSAFVSKTEQLYKSRGNR